MNKNNYGVIMAGGIGSRFWPVSRTKHPKQFLDILGVGKTLLQLTYERFKKIVPEENILIVTNIDYFDLVKKQLPKIEDEQILNEPLRRNTAPCIGYASYKIFNKNPKANILAAPSDHIMLKEDAFVKIAKKGLDYVEKNDYLLTLGIMPTRPDTGYGYIQYLEESNKNGIYKIKTFTEKPSLEIAKTFIKSGDFLWNAGIFIWNVNTIIKAFKKHLPEIHDVFEEGKKHYYTKKESKYIKDAYAKCANISIDYGVMEKAENSCVIPSDFGWSDLGTWKSLYENFPKDYWGNAVSGDKVMVYDTENCKIFSQSNKIVIVEGLKNYIVADTDDALLICNIDQEQQIKEMVAEVKKKFGEKYL